MSSLPKMEDSQNIIGNTLKKLRIDQSLTQDNLAARCSSLGWDVTENTITKVETGVRCVTDKELVVLAQALRVKLVDLLPKYSKLF